MLKLKCRTTGADYEAAAAALNGRGKTVKVPRAVLQNLFFDHQDVIRKFEGEVEFQEFELQHGGPHGTKK
jgi:hypothetical protein